MPNHSSTLRKQPLGDRFDVASSAALLAALQAAHRQIESALNGIEAVGATEIPDLAKFSAARLKIGQLNLVRRQIARKVFSHLISVTSAEQGESLRAMQRRDLELSQLLSEHIGHWTPTAIQIDWQGYCDAAKKMRNQLREMVSLERSILYPLLQQPETNSRGRTATD